MRPLQSRSLSTGLLRTQRQRWSWSVPRRRDLVTSDRAFCIRPHGVVVVRFREGRNSFPPETLNGERDPNFPIREEGTAERSLCATGYGAV